MLYKRPFHSISGQLLRTGLLLGLVVLAAGCAAGTPSPSAVPASPVPATAGPVAQNTATRPAAAPTLLPASSTAAVPTATAAAATLAPTRVPSAAPAAACKAPAALTPALTEGPFFKANTPERTSLLEPGTAGTPLTLTGYVLSVDCQPVARALLEFWQADARGQYDNAGYTLRGHQYTDANGRYQLTTVNPGLYPGRTEHIHVKVQAPGGPVLTSQLFFPNAAGNTGDAIFNRALLVTPQGDAAGGQASFNFIIALK